MIMSTPVPDNDQTEREPPNWYVLPIVAAIIIAIFVAYRFGCSTH